MKEVPEVLTKLREAMKIDMGRDIGKHGIAADATYRMCQIFLGGSLNPVRSVHGIGEVKKDEAMFMEQVALLLEKRPINRGKLLEWALCLPAKQACAGNPAEKLMVMKVEGMARFMMLSRQSMRYGGRVLQPESMAAEIQNDYVVRHEITKFNDKNFYRTREWRELRLAVLSANPKCAVCGCGPEERPLQVDHIKSRSLWPELSLDPTNVQPMCGLCNGAKSNVINMRYGE